MSAAYPQVYGLGSDAMQEWEESGGSGDEKRVRHVDREDEGGDKHKPEHEHEERFLRLRVQLFKRTRAIHGKRNVRQPKRQVSCAE